jgi:hypothetical protein
MPVIQRKPSRQHPEHDALVRELVRHLAPAADDELPAFPRIVEEAVPLSRALRVFVLWDRWESVRDIERSEIILEAYDQARGREAMLQISVASGVTPTEAMQLGMTEL